MRANKLLSYKNVIPALFLAFVATYPLYGTNRYVLHIFVLFFIWSVVASCWNLLNGLTGILSLGNVSFLVLGAYISGILSKNWNVTPLLSVAVGGAGTCLIVTLLLGLPALRLKGIYIALLTLIFANMLSPILTQYREVTGGRMGLHNVPGFFPGMQKQDAYYICFAMFLAVHAVIYFLTKSSTGLAFVTLRDSENLAVSIGVDRFRERIKVFAISSFLTGIAGGFYIHSLSDISPATLGIEPFLMGIAMMQLGGIGTFIGPILGTLVIVFGNEFLRLADTLRLSLLGAIICITILLFPRGIVQLIEAFDRLLAGRRRQGGQGAELG